MKPQLVTETTRYFQQLDHVDYHVQADVPAGREQADYSFRVYLLQPANAGQQGAETLHEYLFDRQVQTFLAKDKTPERFLLRTAVSDLTGTLKLPQQQKRHEIRAEILRSTPDGEVQTVRMVKDAIVVDSEPPTLAQPLSEVRLNIGKPFRINVRLADNVAGLREVEWSWQLAGKELREPQFLPVEPLNAADPGDTTTSQATLVIDDTMDIRPGRRKLYLKAVDRAGNKTRDVWELPVVAVAPPPAEVAADKKTTNTLRVSVRLDGSGQRNVGVTLAGPEPRTGTTDANGVAVFSDLPAGEYTVSTTRNSVIVRNKIYSAMPAKATVSPPPSPATQVSLDLK
jgi:hypothetical protein